jgi:signal transduction histidine kinase
MVAAITLRVQRGDAALERTVADHGSGLASRTSRVRAFDRFSRPDGARSSEGAGLGLSIVQAIARAHGGDVPAKHVTGQGAAITIPLGQLHSGTCSGAVQVGGVMLPA